MNTRITAVSLFSALTAVFFMYSAPAQAQATRTWVSGVGDDANPCSRTAPCKTFAGAISKTAVNGEINCLDPGGFGTVTITKSITIDCRLTHGGILSAGINGVTIPFDNFTAVGETRKSVRLRGLAINGADSGTNGVRITGGTAATGTEVFIEDSVIDGIYGGSANGVLDERNGGGKLVLANTVIRNVGFYGIRAAPSLGASGAAIHVSIDNVRVQNAIYGTGFTNGALAMIRRSTFSGNATAGLYADSNAQVNVSDTTTSSNGIGIFNSGATFRISNTDISFNDTGINGATQSYGNNRISGNVTSAGTTPTPIAPGLQ